MANSLIAVLLLVYLIFTLVGIRYIPEGYKWLYVKLYVANLVYVALIAGYWNL